MNLLMQSEKIMKTYTTRTNNGKISRITLSFNAVSQLTYTQDIIRIMCQLLIEFKLQPYQYPLPP